MVSHRVPQPARTAGLNRVTMPRYSLAPGLWPRDIEHRCEPFDTPAACLRCDHRQARPCRRPFAVRGSPSVFPGRDQPVPCVASRGVAVRETQGRMLNANARQRFAGYTVRTSAGTPEPVPLIRRTLM